MLDEGVPQTIESATFVDLAVDSQATRRIPGNREADVVSNAGTGRMWVMLLNGYGERAKSVARKFVDEAMGPNDQAAVIHVHGTMSGAQGFTSNRRLLLEAIDRLQSDDPAEASQGSQVIRSSFEVLEDVCKRLATVGGRRKAILFFDPPALWTVIPERSRNNGPMVNAFMSQRDALRCATRNNVAVNVVSTAGMSTELGGLAGMAAQRAIAEETGGDAIVNSNNWGGAFQRFVRNSNEYYLLGYTPPVEHRDGKFHSLTVRVNRAGATVRARRGYYALDADVELAPAIELDTSGLTPATHEALRLPLPVSGLTIDFSVAPFRRTNGGSVLLAAQARGPDLVLDPGERIEVAYRAVKPDGTATGEFQVYSLDLSAASRESVRANGLRFLEWLRVAPGRQQIRFAVHQPNGKTGMVVGDVDVPDFDKLPLSMSGMVIASQALGTERMARGDELLLKVMGAHPTVERSFRRKDVLTAYAEVYTSGDADQPVVGAWLARANQYTGGNAVNIQAIIPDAGRAGYLARLPLENLQPGSYVLTFDARTRRHQATRQVLFSVDR